MVSESLLILFTAHEKLKYFAEDMNVIKLILLNHIWPTINNKANICLNRLNRLLNNGTENKSSFLT
jgi:hypothetical protein